VESDEAGNIPEVRPVTIPVPPTLRTQLFNLSASREVSVATKV